MYSQSSIVDWLLFKTNIFISIFIFVFVVLQFYIKSMIINVKTKLVDLLSDVKKRYIRLTINMLPDATYYRVLHSLEHQNNKLSSHFDYLNHSLT